MKPVAIIFGNNEYDINRVYAKEQMKRLGDLTDLIPTIINKDNAAANVDLLEKVEVIFATWGFPVLPEELIEKMTNLRAIFYAASSVKYFAEPYLKRGVSVIPGAYANGEFVARYTMSQIFLSGKNYFRHVAGLDVTPPAHDSHHLTVGVIGAGNIGRLMIRMLLAEGHDVLVYDPYLHEDLGARQVTLEELFEGSDIVTNHAPNTPETRGMLNRHLFELMKPGATFINTGRGASVDESDMCEVFIQRTDLTALLDVTYPEPMAKNSPMRLLKNIIVTPHIAGALGTEVTHMADFCIDQYEEYQKTGKCSAMITLEELPRLS